MSRFKILLAAVTLSLAAPLAMSSSPNIEPGCRVAMGGDVYDVLEEKEKGVFRCQRAEMLFEKKRDHVLREESLTWCRTADGHEYARDEVNVTWHNSDT